MDTYAANRLGSSVGDVGKAGNIIGRHSRQALVNGSGKRGVSQAGKRRSRSGWRIECRLTQL